MVAQGLLRTGLFIRKKVSLYTPEQVSQYLQCLGCWEHFTSDDIKEGKFSTTLKNLAALVRSHAVTFSFDDLDMHYTKDGIMDIDPQNLFQKLVLGRRGSYCFGQNTLFLEMLRGLGYRAYAALGRVNLTRQPNLSPVFTGLAHMVILVQLGEEHITYVVDDGCAGSGPTTPILLSDSESNIVMGTTPTEKHRLRRRPHPDASVDLDEWFMEVLHEKPDQDNSESAWRTIYMFTEREAFPKDFELSNRGVYTTETNTYAEQVICSLHRWFEEDTKVDPSERRMERIGLTGRELKRFSGSTTEHIRTISSEEERAEVLREYFDIELTREELEYIRGRRSAL